MAMPKKFYREINFMSTNSVVAIGVGSGAIGTLDQVIACKPEGVRFVAVSRDVRLLAETSIGVKLLLGDDIKVCREFSCDTLIGQSTEKTKKIMANALKGAEMVFISVDLGVVTDSGAAPFIAKIAHDMGILAIGLVAMPCDLDGERIAERARLVLSDLKTVVDVLFEYKKDRLIESDMELSTLDVCGSVSQYFSFIILSFTDLFSSSNKGILLGLKRSSIKVKPIEFP